jgi:hypothetical protein
MKQNLEMLKQNGFRVTVLDDQYYLQSVPHLRNKVYGYSGKLFSKFGFSNEE